MAALSWRKDMSLLNNSLTLGFAAITMRKTIEETSRKKRTSHPNKKRTAYYIHACWAGWKYGNENSYWLATMS